MSDSVVDSLKVEVAVTGVDRSERAVDRFIQRVDQGAKTAEAAAARIERSFQQVNRARFDQSIQQNQVALDRFRQSSDQATGAIQQGAQKTGQSMAQQARAAQQAAQAEQRAADASRALLRAKGDLQGALNRTQAALQAEAQGTLRSIQLQKEAVTTQRQLDRTNQQTSAAVRALARANGDYAGALRLTQQALQGTEAGTRQYLQLAKEAVATQRQLDQAQQSSSHALATAATSAGTLRGAYSALTGALAGAGFAIGAQQVLELGRGAVRSALELQKTQNIVRGLAGDHQLYAQAVALAKDQQRLFGGSLNDNIAQLGGLSSLARKTGLDLAGLNDVAQRFTLLDSTASISDAVIALREAFSGDITSLAERFELPRTELRKLTDQSLSAADKLGILNDLLERNGIAAGAAAQAVPEATKAYNELKAAVEGVITAFGAQVAKDGAPIAKLATEAVNAFSNARAEAAQIFADSSGVQEFNERIAAANANLGPLVPKTQELSQAQFELGQRLMATGLTAEQVLARLTQFPPALQQVVDQGTNANNTLEQAVPLMIRLAAESDNGAAGVNRLVEQFMRTGDVEAFQTGLTSLTAALAEDQALASLAAFATEDLTNKQLTSAQAAEAASAALYQNAEAATATDIQSQLLSQTKADLATRADMAATAILASGDASLSAMQRYASLFGVSLQLVEGMVQVKQAARDAAVALAGVTGDLDGGHAARKQNQRDSLDRVDPNLIRKTAELKRQAAEAAALAEANRRLAETQGGDAVRLKNLQNDLAKLKAGTAAYVNKQAEIEALKQSMNRKAGGGRQAPKAGIDRDTKADLALADDLEKLRILKERLAKAKEGSTVAKEIQAEINKVQARIDKKQAAAGRAATKSDNQAARDAEELERAKLALLEDEEKLAALRTKLDRGGMKEADRLELVKQIRDLEEQIERRRFATLSAEEKIAALRAEAARAETGDLRRQEIAQEILDLEQQITEEREKQVKAAVDAGLAIIEDKRKAAKEEKELAQARAVLESANTSGEQKAAAQLRIEEIGLERQKRQLEIADKLRDAGGQVASGQAGTPQPGAQPGTPSDPRSSTRFGQPEIPEGTFTPTSTPAFPQPPESRFGDPGLPDGTFAPRQPASFPPASARPAPPTVSPIVPPASSVGPIGAVSPIAQPTIANEVVLNAFITLDGKQIAGEIRGEVVRGQATALRTTLNQALAAGVAGT